jgi:hypothetical protein
MPLTSREKQRRFKEKMYEAGFKQKFLWIKRKEGRQPVKMTQAEFLRNLNKITAGWDKGRLTRLYCLFIEIAKGDKEAAKIIRRQ